MTTPAEFREETVRHLDKAKGEVDAAWSVLHGTDEEKMSVLVADLGRNVDEVTDIIRGQVTVCDVCHKVMKPGEPCFQLRQGGIEEDGITFLPDRDIGYYHQRCLASLPWRRLM